MALSTAEDWEEGDYEPKELADALGPGQTAYCGVPSSLFIPGASHREIVDFARRILDEMGDKVHDKGGP